MAIARLGAWQSQIVAEETPEANYQRNSLTASGWRQSVIYARKIAFALNLKGDALKKIIPLIINLYKAFIDEDFDMLEINPLVTTQGGKLHCLDAKINIDTNAIYRQPEIQEMHDPSQEDPRESEAAMHDLSYVSLEGNIGCMVNGAGLAMGTMDIIKLYGGEPANFLD